MRALIFSAALLVLAAPALAQSSPVTVTVAQNGGTVEAAQGATLSIELAVNPSTGAHWDVMEKPDFLGDPMTTIAPAALAPGQRPRLGAPQMATTTFEVSGAGAGVVVMEMHGPVADGPALQDFRVTVNAQ